MIPFKLKDKVIYTSGSYDDHENDPLWGGKHGYQIGEVVRIEDQGLSIKVRWDKSRINTYKPIDLEYAYTNPNSKIVTGGKDGKDCGTERTSPEENRAG